MRTVPSRALITGCLTAAVLLASAAPAPAQPIGQTFVPPPSYTRPPATFRIDAKRALAAASRLPQLRAVVRRHPDLSGRAFIGGPGLWDLEFAPANDWSKPVAYSLAEVLMNGQTGATIKVWTGIQASDPLARGHIGGVISAGWLWALLCVLFIAPFVDLRRPRRMLHLDLLALLAFSISYHFFNGGDVAASVPLVYPVLVYLLVRMLVVGSRPRVARERLVPHISMKALWIALAALVAGRIALNIDARVVLDAGAAGVVGAYRMLHNLPLWGHSPGHADTYGPVNYIAYIPFETALPWKGRWTGTLGAAHAASIAFDLLTMGGLFALGCRLRRGLAGRHLGLALAFAWAACPFTLLTLGVNENDALISMLLTFALLAATSAPARGGLLALAAAAKFAPLALAPLFAAGDGRRRGRQMLVAGGTIVALFVLTIVVYLPKDGGLATFWKATIGFQLTRVTNFSVWVQHPALAPLQLLAEIAAGALAVAVAFFPRRRDSFQIAALAAAVLIAIELPARYWFYFYIVWFLPFVLVALFGAYGTDRVARAPDEIETTALLGVGQAQRN